MDLILPILILLGIAAAWTALPFIPAVRELRERKDVAPIPIVRESETDIEHFAQGHRRFLAEHLAAARTRCRKTGERQGGWTDDGFWFEVLPRTESDPTPASDGSPDLAETLMLACGDLRLPGDQEYLRELYAAGSIHGDTGNAYRAILSDKSIELGDGSAVLRWAHAEHEMHVGAGSRLYGRVSAGEAIDLGAGCRFERMHAPRIQFGPPFQIDTPAAVGHPLRPADLPGIVDVAGGRWLFRGDLKIPAQRIVEESLVATGTLEIETGARVEGGVKAHEDVVLDDGVEVFGSVVAGRNIRMGEGCRIHGPVLAEDGIRIARGTRIGSANDATTVSARVVEIDPGVVCYGTVWAHGEGHTAGDDAAAAVPANAERLEALRYQGCHGGFISRHRALLFSPCDAGKIGGVIGLTVASLVVWGLLLGPVARLWEGLMGFYGSVFGVAQPFGMAHYTLGGLGFDVPVLIVPAGLPTPFLWWCGALFTIALLAASLLIPRRHLPAAYALWILAFFQGCSQAFFAIRPEAFPYTATGYIHTMLIAGLMLTSLIPVVLAFTYYLFDFGLRRNVALTAAILLHLTVMIPLQYATHAFVLYHGSLLFLPLLFFVFGLPLNVFVFIALYSWGFSWNNQLHDQRVQWKVRGRFV